MLSYSSFVETLKDNFGTIDPVRDAEMALDSLKMLHHHRITKFNVIFQQHASKLVGWGDKALRYMYYNALPDRIKDELSRSPKKDTLSALRAAASDIDQRYWERQKEKKSDPSEKSSDKSAKKSTTSNHSSKPASTNSAHQSSSNSSNSGNKSSSSSSSKPASKSSAPPPAFANQLGKDGKLKPEVRAERIRKGLCLFCGGSGHRVKECPNGNSNSAKARAAVAEESETSEQEASISEAEN